MWVFESGSSPHPGLAIPRHHHQLRARCRQGGAMYLFRRDPNQRNLMESTDATGFNRSRPRFGMLSPFDSSSIAVAAWPGALSSAWVKAHQCTSSLVVNQSIPWEFCLQPRNTKCTDDKVAEQPGRIPSQQAASGGVPHAAVCRRSRLACEVQGTPCSAKTPLLPCRRECTATPRVSSPFIVGTCWADPIDLRRLRAYSGTNTSVEASPLTPQKLKQGGEKELNLICISCRTLGTGVEHQN